jgi:uncharacterized protein (TIGR02284 family)
MDNQQAVQTTLDALIQVNHESKRNIYAAAEQIENRALKLLLKASAQQRARLAYELQQAGAQAVDRSEEATLAPGFFQRGWLDLRSALLIRRQRRHRILLAELAELETNTLQIYATAVASTLPATLRTLVDSQYEQVRIFHNRLTVLAKQLEHRVALRLFNEDKEAQQVVGRLKAMGIPDNELVVIPIEEIAVYQNDQQAKPRVKREAIVTGVILGTVAGGLLGLLYGAFQRFYFPEFNGFIATTPVTIMLEIGLYGAIIGAFFSFIFSTLIASSAAETDTYLYEDSFQQGDTLVIVFADVDNFSEVERIIGLKHEQEIEPVVA